MKPGSLSSAEDYAAMWSVNRHQSFTGHVRSPCLVLQADIDKRDGLVGYVLVIDSRGRVGLVSRYDITPLGATS